MPEFRYQDPFPLAKDETKYRLLSKEHVTTTTFEGQEILKVEPQALSLQAREAFREISFFYRARHLAQVAAILDDPEASPNDRGVALALLRTYAPAGPVRLLGVGVAGFAGAGADDPAARPADDQLALPL